MALNQQTYTKIALSKHLKNTNEVFGVCVFQCSLQLNADTLKCFEDIWSKC